MFHQRGVVPSRHDSVQVPVGPERNSTQRNSHEPPPFHPKRFMFHTTGSTWTGSKPVFNYGTRECTPKKHTPLKILRVPCSQSPYISASSI